MYSLTLGKWEAQEGKNELVSQFSNLQDLPATRYVMCGSYLGSVRSHQYCVFKLLTETFSYSKN